MMMSMNARSGRLVWDVVCATGTSRNPSRLVHSSARNLLSSSFASIRPGPHSSQNNTSSAFRVNQDIHARKRRRYSSSPAFDTLTDKSEGAERTRDEHASGEDAQSSTSSFSTTGRRGEREGHQYGRGSVSAENTSRSVKGQRSPSDADNSNVKNHRRKKQVELRDLVEPSRKKRSEPWQIQKQALQEKFGSDGWNPRKKLSPDTMEGIRALHAEDPGRYSTPLLAEHFKVSPEAIRRILKSKWRPSEKELEKRRERWAKRHDRIWDQQAELGLRPKRTAERSIEDPDEFEENLRAKEILDNARNA